MAPRNNDANANYKKKNLAVEDNEVEIKSIVPSLLHKKHKVVKLVKSQLLKIQEEGLICSTAGSDAEEFFVTEDGKPQANRRLTREIGKAGTSNGSYQYSSNRENLDSRTASESRNVCFCTFLLFLVVFVFLLLLAMVWISAGPLSNTVAHTPIPVNSFVRTDSLCTLEKKYLLRWSKPEYYE